MTAEADSRVRSTRRRAAGRLTSATHPPETGAGSHARRRPWRRPSFAAPTSTIEATYRNLSTAELYEHAVRNGEGTISAHGSLVVRTGKHTGRSPQDKFVVKERSSAGKIWWGSVNQPISEEHYDRLRARLMKYVADRPIYSQDLYIGAHPDHRRSLRVTPRPPGPASSPATCSALPPAEDLARLRAELPIIDVPSFKADPATEGVAQRDRDPAPPQADGDHHRRHRVRRRDQEVGLHGDELPPARRGRPADALVGQRRSRRRPRALLRALGHRQDDALRRSGAQPHRRRRARLGSPTASSTSRAAATPRRSASRRCTSPTSSPPPAASARSSRTSTSTRPPASSTSTPSATPRTRAAPTRWSSSATPIRPA